MNMRGEPLGTRSAEPTDPRLARQLRLVERAEVLCNDESTSVEKSLQVIALNLTALAIGEVRA